ncbi:competence type IV pilus minor pilin ComGE [Bacillus nakamurai]|uniref:Competence protein ComGE n=1 Tax=Bacillus nakamurai TaxID=1793963 RepID=A0A150F714_9BACI|nr:competence type IV pilus minor pilin ComGE [Bacillus nakamurai]KXZ18511.1 competence protein ComGE [Bacillus nakamurai]MED1229452.1 competence type IV pilus minor pilin ComGE [Bacillus nakamurai]
MQNGNKGFSTIESLSALAIWLFFMISIVPVWSGMLADEQLIEDQKEAYQLLRENIGTYMMSGKQLPSSVVTWKEEGDYQKVCTVIRGEKNVCLSILSTKWLYAS